MPAGRPQIEISKEQFERLCALQCTLIEIAGFFSCSEDTIERWCIRTYDKNFAEVFREKRCAGKISLRRAQFKMAEKNPTMAIWLGKQYLDQREKQEISVSRIDDETVREMERYFEDRKAGDSQSTMGEPD